MKYASEILQIASNLVSGDRQKQHGDKIANHKNIATLWSAYLDKDISGHDVAILMSLLKIARTKLGSFNIDDYYDGTAYIGIAGEIKSKEKDRNE
ncbi:MAG: hypothetical protein CMB64_01615 [Euryarchaeota archaeon]|nr:hypothetical protein [Euryarchaeota archaeon]|tara:strand:+ start:111 stop:395 length:285 start_codon:yes stop_codon:yes gene_type:complete